MKNENKPILHIKSMIVFDLIAITLLLLASGNVLSNYINHHAYSSLWLIIAVAYFPIRYFLINLVYSLTDAKFYNDYMFFDNKDVIYKDIDFVEIKRMLLRDSYRVKFQIKKKIIRIRVKHSDISEFKRLLSENNVHIIVSTLVS